MSTKVITVKYKEGKEISDLTDLEVLAVLHHNLSVGSVRLLVRASDEKGNQQTLEMSPAGEEELAKAYQDAARNVTFFCTGEKSDGSRCTREVDEAGGKCWQHSPAEQEEVSE